MAVKANELAPEPDDAELKFKKGMALVLENIDKVDEKLLGNDGCADGQSGAPLWWQTASNNSQPLIPGTDRKRHISTYFNGPA
ncbi:hypothetical protein ACLB1N_34315 [Escherichia coli]